MRLLHAADLHLGFRAYTRSAPEGVNQREADVAGTFHAMIEQMIALKPDAIVFAGDIFHVPRPSNQAIMTAYTGFSRLVEALPSCIVVMIAGNHDVPRTGESCNILRLIEQLGIHVADRGVERLMFGRLAVLCVPEVPGLIRPALEPTESARYNVLLLHGEAEGVKQGGANLRPSHATIPRTELNVEQWDYIALGHYHQYEQLAPNMAYAGSIDFTSSNIWGEIGTPKGFVERNLATGEQTFHTLPSSRTVIDAPAIHARGLTPAEIVAGIKGRLWDCPKDAVVRLVIHDIERDIDKALDKKVISEYKRRFLHFNLDRRRPLPGERDSKDMSPEEILRERRKSVREVVDEKLASFGLAPDVDRGAFMAAGQKYLELTTPADADDAPLQQEAA